MDIDSDEELVLSGTYTFQLSRKGYLQLKMAVNNAYAMSSALLEFANKHANKCSAPCYFNSHIKEDYYEKCMLLANDFEEKVKIFSALLNEMEPDS